MPEQARRHHRSWLAALAALTLAGLIGVAPATAAPPPPKDKGAQPGTLFGFNEDPVASGYPLQRKLNAPVRRLMVGWNSVERTRGTYDWSATDAQYSQITSAGLRPLLVAGAAPSWAVLDGSYSSTGWSPPAPSFDPDWARFVRTLTARYPQAIGIEVWSEPNFSLLFLPVANAVRYTELLKAAYGAVKSANPSMPVVSGGLFPAAGDGTAGNVMGVGDETFLAQMYAAGAGPYIDAIGDHPYPATVSSTWSTAATTQALDRVRAVRDAAGAATTPIWVTETGESTVAHDAFPAASLTQQSTDLVTLVRYFTAQPDIPVALIHRLVDQPGTSVESGFWVFTAGLSPKPSACALSREWRGTLRC
jgi:hypothetical protein